MVKDSQLHGWVLSQDDGDDDGVDDDEMGSQATSRWSSPAMNSHH